jgi:hypothetical protein
MPHEIDHKPHSHSGLSLLSSLYHYPQNTKIAHQETDERILLIVRRHFITNISWVVITLFLLLIPPFVTALQQQFAINLLLPPTYLLILLLFYYLVVLGFAFVNLFSWFYNIGVVTSLRVIDVDAPTILSQTVSSSFLPEIVDVSYSQKGFLQGLFNFGDVHVQTEALRENFEFLSVPQPSKISDIILDAKEGRETND